ncbi:MAG: ParB/RepB/Spo0J family partition protein [Clostridia bacterium]|nr:ParB/RepB/Spo0J family partition protein [Clostridia bacterium]
MQNDCIKRGGRILYIGVGDISPSPNQPRKTFSDVMLNELAQSIRENGILQPLTVRRLDKNRWTLVAGERRLRAAKMVGLQRVPCVEISATDEQAAVLTLIENLQRSDLSFFQEAQALLDLMKITGMSQEQTAAKIGKSQSAVANKLRLLKLSPELRDMIEAEGLSERHARALLSADQQNRESILRHVIDSRLNVEQTEKYIKSLDGSQKPRRRFLPVVRDVRIFLNTINHALEVMKKSGIDAQSKRSDFDGYIEYLIKIPRSSSKGQK